MARYKHIDTSPRLLVVDLSQQLLPGTFEHALNYLLDHEMDLSGLDARFCNDDISAREKLLIGSLHALVRARNPKSSTLLR